MQYSYAFFITIQPKDNTDFHFENLKMQPIYNYAHTEMHILSICNLKMVQ